MVYWIKRKYRQIERTLSFLPLIWNGFDFDYRYATDLFRKQLERIADEMESDRGRLENAKTNAQKIRTAIRLMDKVYDEEYGCESKNKQKKAHKLLWNFIEHNIQNWWD
jgi:hypothetical protein